MSTLAAQPQQAPEPDPQAQADLLKRYSSFWKERIQSAAKLSVYEKQTEDRKEAINFYKGEFFAKKETEEWEGDVVQANLFVRYINFLVDTVFSENPTFQFMVRQQTPEYQAYVETISKHIRYVFEELDIKAEIKRILKDAQFSAISAAKINFDRQRGLWGAKWVAGQFICDPDAHGDLSRARWTAEKVVLPRYRVWQDEMFDPVAREELKAKLNTEPNYTDDKESKQSDNVTLWFIRTKEGVDPVQGTDTVKNRLLVVCDEYQSFLLNQENPTPYLDDDEVEYEVFRPDEVPGEFISPAPWRHVQSIVRAFNWAASYHSSDMRKTASKPIGYDKNKLDDPALLKSRKHRVSIPCDGDPKTIVTPMDVGQADKTIFDSVQFWSGMMDKVTGVDNIARGEEGKTKTATESQILQQNSNIALRGVASAFDKFLNGLVRKIALATVYYIPAWSVVQDQMGNMWTKQPFQIPQFDPVTQMPMGMQMQVQYVPAPPGSEPVKGIDHFHGDEAALTWLQLPYDQIKCELTFRIEAGSTRAERKQDKQRQATELIQTYGVRIQMMGLFGEEWELWNQLLDCYEVDKSKLLPPKDAWMMLGQQAMMMQQMAAQQGPEGKKPNKEKGNSATAGKDFPLTRQPGKDQSSGT